MERFSQRPGTVVYDYAMPQNAESYGGSFVSEPNGATHKALTHSKVLIWPEKDPGTPCSVTIVSGNGSHSDPIEVGPGATEYVVPAPGLVSVEPVDGTTTLVCYASVFPVWAG